MKDIRSKAAARREMNRRDSEPQVDVDVDLDDDDVVGEVEPEIEDDVVVAKPKKRVDKVKALRRDDFSRFDRDDIRGMNDDGEFNFD
jgi:hypothetical protein